MKKYSYPSIRLISLGAEASTLYTTSEIPSSDNPGYFDTKQQRSIIWQDDEEEEDY